MNPPDHPSPSTVPPPWMDPLDSALEPFQGAGVVAAVSGGGDSVALLLALAALRDQRGWRLSVATFDHGTRAGESTRDAEFVADLARRLDLPCDVGRWEADRPGCRSADARRARYAWLAGVARARGAAAVATAHTRDDQAETIAHRIVRGTGLRGLAGMAPSRPLVPGVTLIRPLLGASRSELRDYLVARGEPWREDATNADTTRTRGRIRHDLLPRLASDYNPAVAEALVRLGTLAADASTRLDRRAARLLRRLTVERGPGWIDLDRDQLRRLGPGDRADLLRAAWRALGWPEGAMTLARWVRLADQAGTDAPGRFDVGLGIETVATPDRWTLRRVAAPIGPAPECPLAVPGSTSYLGGRLWATLGEPDPNGAVGPVAGPGRVERLDADQVVGPCIVRAPRPGDRLDPLGLGGRSQALADLLRGRGVARQDRAAVPVVADSAGILWVVGHRIAHRVRQTEATRRVLELRWESPGSASE